MEINKEKLPNFFVVGAAKSGTTSLYEYMKMHPQIYMAPIKETHHFSTDIDNTKFRPNYSRSLNKDLSSFLETDMKEGIFHAFVKERSQYEQLFKNVNGEKAIGEITNSYLYSTEAARNIFSEFPNAKVIMMLRNPIERAFSHYLMDLRIGYERDDFMTALKKDMARNPKGWGISNLYIEIGMYYEQVKRFIDIFPERQRRIYLFDDFKKDAGAVVKDMFAFLNVNPDVEIDYSQKFNPSFIPKNRIIGSLNSQKRMKDWLKGMLPKSIKSKFKKTLYTNKNLPKIKEEERRFLADIFHDDVLKLGELINRDFSSWVAEAQIKKS
ncbi:MAG: sulfotransferase [Chitinophagales bacterium]|nr:sulfotransferase [Chitinophagales bacterium]